jgi:hypothetical protein
MGRLEEKDDTYSIVRKLAQNNVGAMNVLLEILSATSKFGSDAAAKHIFKILDKFEIYGESIYVLHNDICKREIRSTIILIKGVDLKVMDSKTLKDACWKGDTKAIDLDALKPKIAYACLKEVEKNKILDKAMKWFENLEVDQVFKLAVKYMSELKKIDKKDPDFIGFLYKKEVLNKENTESTESTGKKTKIKDLFGLPTSDILSELSIFDWFVNLTPNEVKILCVKHFPNTNLYKIDKDFIKQLYNLENQSK